MRKESVTGRRTWAQIPRLLLSPECDGGSPAAVASFLAALAAREDAT
jgi:hypothetical protein